MTEPAPLEPTSLSSEAWTRAGRMRMQRKLASLQAEAHLLSPEAQSALRDIVHMLGDALSFDRLEPTLRDEAPGGSLDLLWSGGEAEFVEPLLQGLAEGMWPRLTLVPDLASGLAHLQRASHDLWVIGSASEAELEHLATSLATLPDPPVVVVLDRTSSLKSIREESGGLFEVLEGELSPARLGQLASRALVRRRLLSDLALAQKRLEELVHRDPLTGLYNRRYFDSRLQVEFARAARFGEALSLVLFDIDHFKSINDTHGHPTGDTVLKEVSRMILAGVRSIDLVARVGGEEFALLLPNTGTAGARGLVERVLERVRAHDFGASPRVQVTLSAGIATCPCSGCEESGALYGQADQALYAAKRHGRDRVELFRAA